jgi:hypothetical protein
VLDGIGPSRAWLMLAAAATSHDIAQYEFFTTGYHPASCLLETAGTREHQCFNGTKPPGVIAAMPGATKLGPL